MYIRSDTLLEAIRKLYGTAHHFFKIWCALKHMGLKDGQSVEIDTSNSENSLRELFSFGDPEGKFFVPFAHTSRYLTMRHDAARSIIQTTIQRWATSQSVVTCNPDKLLNFDLRGSKILVSIRRTYPLGLGWGTSGFARQNETRLNLPITPFAIWIGRITPIPDSERASEFLIAEMLSKLNISEAERNIIFVEDDFERSGMLQTQDHPLKNDEIFSVCSQFMENRVEPIAASVHENFQDHSRRIASMVTNLKLPPWMRTNPEDEVHYLLSSAQSKAILLYGPPRTSKTWCIDKTFPRGQKDRCTIQIHDGWGYDHLIEGFKPDEKGNWAWRPGPLKTAIKEGKKIIVLEEINRTNISQALGEVFSLIEESYRGKENHIVLRSGEPFSIPPETVFILTMNTVDKSTETVDDALMGRISAVEFLPRAEELSSMLEAKEIRVEIRDSIKELFSSIQEYYPLGHGYFSGLRQDTEYRHVIRYYKARIRPVLRNYLGNLRNQDLETIDNLVDEKFGVSK